MFVAHEGFPDMPHSEVITIVSGLPRSGTSLMMQMIDRGGIPALTDEIRTADTDNPKGYYEFEPVKRTKEDPSWLNDAQGKVVKMVSSLLYDLPLQYEYRIVFMRRDIDEILESQEKMLTRLGRPLASKEEMASAFAVHLERLFQWLPTQPSIVRLDVSYNDLLTDTETELQRLVSFLGEALDAEKMLNCIDPKLYRNRGPKNPSDITIN